MRKYLIVILLLNLMTVSPAIADVTTGACWDPYGYAHRAGNHISNTCLIMKNGGCIACGINNYNGCSGGCSGEGVGNPGYQPEGSIVGAFKCLARIQNPTQTQIQTPTRIRRLDVTQDIM